MPYTYDDFINTATSSGNLSKFTTDDLDLAYSNPEYGMSMLSLMNDYSGAQTDEQRALINETQNQLRNSYRTKTARAAQGNGYNSVYQPQIDDLTNKALTHGSFNFDLKNNPAWSTYKKNYLREGDRAAANALAAASNASAGRPSSYAITAAQQANDYWDTQLANIIPTLYNQSYAEWTDDFNKILTNLELLRGQDESEYARYLDQLNLDYQKERDAADDSQRNFANALSIYQLLGGGSPKWVLEALGLGGSGGAGGIAGDSTGSGSGSGGGYGSGGSYTDEYGNTADDYQRVQDVFDRWNQGKFTASDATTIADTPQILELLMTDADGNAIGSVPTDAAERRRMANQLMLDYYGDWQDRGYLKDRYGNFIRDENGNPVPDGTGTAAGTWTADDQREEQMMIRRMDNVEAGMSSELNEDWETIKQAYQNGNRTKKEIYDALDKDLANGAISYADYRILTTRVNALPSDPSQIGNGGAYTTGETGTNGTGSLAGTETADVWLPGYRNPAQLEPSVYTPDLLAEAARSGNLAGYIRNYLNSIGVDTSIVPDDQIVSAAAAAADDVQKTTWQQKNDEQLSSGSILDNMILGRTTDSSGAPREGRNLIEILRDYFGGIKNVNGQAAVSDYEALAATPEGREANAAQMEAYRDYVPTGNAAMDEARLREIGSMGTGLYYDEATGTIKSTAPNVGDATGRVGEAIGTYGQILDNYMNDQSALLSQSDPNGALVQTILQWVNDRRNNQQQPASGSTPLEYSDAFLRQQDMQDAYSPYASYNTQQPATQPAAQTGTASGSNVYQNILDAAAAARNLGGNIAGAVGNAANSLQSKIQNMLSQQSGAQQQTSTLPVPFNPSGNRATDTMNLQRLAAALPGYTYDPSEDYPGTAPGTGTIKPVQQTAASTGSGNNSVNYSQILDNVKAAAQSAAQSAGTKAMDTVSSLVNKLTSKIQDVQAQQAAAQAAAEQAARAAALREAAAQAAAGKSAATYAGSWNQPSVVVKPSQSTGTKATATKSARTNTKVKQMTK